ncbi:MAG TPA: outer membrane beta-barrel family protein [Chitinophagaceae bacterium]|nr:outer membrane beta-barrel family protein [Chitinophagaceae bacterium]
MRSLLLSLLTAITAFAQAQQINGFVKDDNGAPLPGATVSLIRDSSTIKLAVTKQNGSFDFSGIRQGSYKVMISHIGYKPAFSPKFSFTETDVTVTELKLSKAPADLSNVNVTSRKPMLEVKADKMVVNVEGTINAVGSNALELLRKSPGVSFDKDDNISMAGKNGVQIYIDNRQTPLSGQDLAAYLKTLQSSQVESIELITNPSAKYDAAGNAGIINIRLIKNKSFGTNGSVNAGWNVGVHAKYNAGASLNYRNRKINLFGTYSFNYGPSEQNLKIQRTVLDSLFDQQGIMRDRRKSHNFKIGADYFINKRNTIGVMLNGILADPNSESNTKSYISSTKDNMVDRILVARNKATTNRNNLNANLNYNYADTKGRSLIVNADRGEYDLHNDQFQPNYYYDASGITELTRAIYHIVSPAQIHINSVRADYEQNFLKGKLSFGGKSSWIKTDNDFQSYNVSGSTEELDKNRSNHFIYKENINAGYVNYNKQFKKLIVQAGLRAENTISEGVSNGLKFDAGNYTPSYSSFKRSYTDLFPSASITYNKNPKQPWSLSYGRRIDRPAYQDLNPFEFKLDEYTYMKGNVNLRPQYTDVLTLTHITKYRMTVALNYSHVKDMFTMIIDTIEKTKAVASRKNLATQDVASLNVSYPFQYKSYSLFTNISSNYSIYNADFGLGRKVDLQAFGVNVFVQNSLKFAKIWTAELSGFYNAPTIYMGNFRGKSIYSVDAGLSRQLMRGRAVVKTSVSDIFHNMKFRGESNFAGQTTKFSFSQESRQFKLSFSYRFGSNTVKAARQRSTGAEDELKRVQQTGSFIGGN